MLDLKSYAAVLFLLFMWWHVCRTKDENNIPIFSYSKVIPPLCLEYENEIWPLKPQNLHEVLIKTHL